VRDHQNIYLEVFKAFIQVHSNNFQYSFISDYYTCC